MKNKNNNKNNNNMNNTKKTNIRKNKKAKSKEGEYRVTWRRLFDLKCCSLYVVVKLCGVVFVVDLIF